MCGTRAQLVLGLQGGGREMQKQSVDARDAAHRGTTRRAFLGAGVAGSAALLTGGLSALLQSSTSAAVRSDGPWIEASIPELQALMASGELTSRELTRGYLAR